VTVRTEEHDNSLPAA